METTQGKNMYNLLPYEVFIRTPGLYETELIPNSEKQVQATYYQLFGSNWTYYLVEYDMDNDRAFGLVLGNEAEWGYFSLEELRQLRFTRDLTKEYPQTFRELQKTELERQMYKEEIDSVFTDNLSKSRLDVMKIAIDKHIDKFNDVDTMKNALGIKNEEKQLINYITTKIKEKNEVSHSQDI